jgi:hypothetical protein
MRQFQIPSSVPATESPRPLLQLLHPSKPQIPFSISPGILRDNWRPRKYCSATVACPRLEHPSYGNDR